MCPGVQPFLFQIRNDLVILLCKSGSKIPGTHHVYIIFVRFNFGYLFRIFRFKLFIQIIPHQHSNSKTDDIRVIRCYPATDFLDKYVQMIFYCPERDHITGCPVIYIREKTVQCGNTGWIVFNLFNQQSMKVVFFIIFMWKHFKKCRNIVCFTEFFCVCAQRRSPHTDDGFLIDCRHQFCLKIPISKILYCKEICLYIFYYFSTVHLSFSPEIL